MQQKADIPLALLDRSKSTPLIDTYFEVVHLKQLFRAGWLQRGMKPSDCETVAEHSFGNALLCLLLLDEHPTLDAARVLRLALIHDIGEVYVGDITPQDNVERSDKVRQETDAVTQIFGKLPNGKCLIADWLEYEAQQTPESQFVKQIDRLELALQASVYEHQGNVDATEFHRAAEANMTSAILIREMAALRQLRP